ncbi:MAG: O-antigen ligase family protein [Monoglobales bacterium]
MKKLKATEHSEKISFYAAISAIYFMCMPLSIVPLPGGFSLLKFLSIFCGGALVLALFIGEETEIRFNILHLFIGLYLIYSISSLFLLSNENAWVNLRGIIETTALLYLVTIRVYNQREKKLLIDSWLIAGIITVAAMFISGVGVGTSERLTINIGGGSEDPNQLCGYFFAPMLICMDRVSKKSKIGILYVILMLVMIYISFTTGSRGGLVAIFGTIVTYIFVVVKGVYNKLKVLIVLLLVFAIFFSVLFPLLPESVRERMKVESVIEDRGSGRFDLWEIVYKAITKNNKSLIFGYGLGSTTDILLNAGVYNTVAHNHWLQIWCDQGFIGLMLFLAVLLIGGFRSLSDNKIIAVSLFGMLLLSMSLTLYASYKPFWNILMMSAMNYEGVFNAEK